jgi:hypothetical protein
MYILLLMLLCQFTNEELLRKPRIMTFSVTELNMSTSYVLTAVRTSNIIQAWNPDIYYLLSIITESGEQN